MKTEQLVVMPGNIVFVGLRIGCGEYGALILPVSNMCTDGAWFLVPYKDTDALEPESRGWDDMEGVPLSFTPLLELFKITLPDNLPLHIEYFHELQNWYYYTQGKHLIDLKNFDGSDSDAWIDISKQFFAYAE